MTDTVTVKIGGEDIVLPLIMNFATLKRAWPALLAWDAADDPVAKTSSALAFVANVLAKTRPDLTQPALEERLRVARYKPGTDEEIEHDERRSLNQAVRQLAVESGLVPQTPPESPAATTESPSMETGTTSSPS
jgi:hypothetical protein